MTRIALQAVLEFNTDEGGVLDLLGALTDIGEPLREVDIIFRNAKSSRH